MAITYTTKQAQVEASLFLAITPRDGDPVMSVNKVPRTLHPLQSGNPSLRSHCYDSLEHINHAAHPFFSVFAQHPTHSILYCNLNLAPHWRSEKTALTTLANSTIIEVRKLRPSYGDVNFSQVTEPVGAGADVALGLQRHSQGHKQSCMSSPWGSHLPH